MGLELFDYQNITITYDANLRPIQIIYYTDNNKTDILNTFNLAYDNNDDPIIFNQVLKNHRFNIARATFELVERNFISLNNMTFTITGANVIETSSFTFNIPWTFSIGQDILTLLVSGGSLPYLWSIVNDPDDKFQISNNNLQIKTSFNIFSKTNHSVTIRVTDLNGLILDHVFNFNLVNGFFTNNFALDFPGYGTLASDTSMADATSAFSISFWMNMAGGNNALFTRWDGNNNCHWRIYQDNKRPRIEISSDGTENANNIAGIRTATAVTNNIWSHVVFTFDNQIFNVYLNGILDNGTTFGSSQNQMFSNNTQSLEIGESNKNPDLTCNGIIDEFSFFNIELNASQVDELYNSGLPKDLSEFSQSLSLQHWLRFGDSQTSTPGILDVKSGTIEMLFLNGLNTDDFTTNIP